MDDKIKLPVFPETATNKKQDNANQNVIIGDDLGKKTYFVLKLTDDSSGEVNGVLEFDLMSYREKGEEKRFLSINSIGYNPELEATGRAILNISNEGDFYKIKEFFKNLEWND